MVLFAQSVAVRLSSAICLLFVLAIVFAAPEQPVLVKASAAAHSGLHVKGVRLLDGSGKAVLLHGVDIAGTEFACAQGGKAGNSGWSIYGGQPEDTTPTLNAMLRWHVNAVRIPLNEDCWLGINGINPSFGGASYRAAILKFVGHLNSAGMYVIVDLHWNAPGAAIALSQQPMADADHAPAFWSSVASTFATNLNVVFDLYNEPVLYGSYFQNPKDDPWSCWLNGCDLNQYVTGGQPYIQKYNWRSAGMQQLIDAVRATGSSNVVIANGLDWANDNSGWLTHRPTDSSGNLAAGWHEYGGEGCAAIACWSKTIAPIAQVLPVVVGETGDHTGSGCVLTNMPAFLPWADSHGLSYLAWTFNPWLDKHDVLITDWQGTPSACEGEYYFAHLADLAVHPVTPPASASALPSAVPTPPNHPGAAPPPSSIDKRIVYFAIMLIGALAIGAGLLLATNFAGLVTRITPRSSVQSRGWVAVSNRSAIGIAFAACGFIFCLFAVLLLNQQP